MLLARDPLYSCSPSFGLVQCTPSSLKAYPARRQCTLATSLPVCQHLNNWSSGSYSTLRIDQGLARTASHASSLPTGRTGLAGCLVA